MFTEETNTETQQFEQLFDQEGTGTDLALPKQHFEIEAFLQAVRDAEALEEAERGVSVVAKSYKFDTSVAMIEEKAKQMKAEEREKYLADNMRFTRTRGIFQGVYEETVEVIKKTDKGEEKLKEKRHISKWINKEGLWVNFGVQLYRALQPLPAGAKVEIVFLREETNKNGEGSVKIYEVYHLRDKTPK